MNSPIGFESPGFAFFERENQRTGKASSFNDDPDWSEIYSEMESSELSANALEQVPGEDLNSVIIYSEKAEKIEIGKKVTGLSINHKI